ncbi:SGNH/GDSL hydrolase family protein [Bosea sp. NPDC055332]
MLAPLGLQVQQANATEFVCRPSTLTRDAGDLASTLNRGGAPLRILAIGSSSTEGIGASGKDKTYPAQLGTLLRTGLSGRSIEMVNAGIGGETAPQTLSRLKAALVEGHYDLVIWQVGTNDAVTGGDLATFRNLVADGIAAARQARTRLVILDPQFYPGIKETARYRAYVDAIAEVAKAQAVPVLSRYQAMLGWYQRDAEGFMAALAGDRFHMSDAGYGCLAQDIARSLLGDKPAVTLAASVR